MLERVVIGDKVPEEFNVIIEIRRGDRNKYEFDKQTGRLTLDRVNATSLGYPADYGYVPDTLCDDGDPIDVLLVIDESVPYGAVVPCRVVGVVHMIDEGREDDKLIVLPVDDVSQNDIQDLEDLGEHFRQVVEHYFRHYKDWKNDWQGGQVSFKGWGGVAEAKQALQAAVAMYHDNKA